MGVRGIPKAVAVLSRVLDGIAWVSSVIAGIAMVLMTVIFGWLVFGRYVLNATPTWVEQLSLLLIVLITFVGAAVGVHRRTHLNVSYFQDRSPPVLRKGLTLLTHIGLAVFGFAMADAAYELTLFKWDSLIPLIHVPEGLRSAPLVISGIMICLFSVGHILKIFWERDDQHPGPEPGQD